MNIYIYHRLLASPTQKLSSPFQTGASLGSGAAPFHGELQVGVAEGLRGVSVVSLGFVSIGSRHRD